MMQHAAHWTQQQQSPRMKKVRKKSAIGLLVQSLGARHLQKLWPQAGWLALTRQYEGTRRSQSSPSPQGRSCGLQGVGARDSEASDCGGLREAPLEPHTTVKPSTETEH